MAPSPGGSCKNALLLLPLAPLLLLFYSSEIHPLTVTLRKGTDVAERAYEIDLATSDEGMSIMLSECDCVRKIPRPRWVFMVRYQIYRGGPPGMKMRCPSTLPHAEWMPG